MRLLVCGSRDYADRDTLFKVLDQIGIRNRGKIEVLIEGEARGADTLAREWAESYDIPVMKFPADWERYGKLAGPVRNAQMIAEGEPTLVVAFLSKPMDQSGGTRNMVKLARYANLEVIVINHHGERESG